MPDACKHVATEARSGKALTYLCGAFAEYEECRYGRGGQQPRGKGAYAGSCKTEFGRTHMAENQSVVSDYVQQVSAKDYPHGGAAVGGSVAPLCKHVEYAYRHDASKRREIVRADERKQLIGLAEAVQVEIEQAERSCERHAVGHVQIQAVAHKCAYVMHPLLPEHGSNKGGQTVGEPQAAEYHDVEDPVDERCRCKGFCGVSPDHYIVGECSHYHAKLAHKNWQAEPDDVVVIILLSHGWSRRSGEDTGTD